MTSVYFLRVAENGPVKVGFTAGNAIDRMAELQCGCPWPLRLIGSVPGTKLNEGWLHAQLDDCRMMGEWFEPLPPVTSLMESVLASGFEWPSRQLTPVDRAIAIAGSVWDLCKAIKCSQPAISKARKTGRVGPHTAIAIHHFTNGEVSAAELRPDLWSHPHQVPNRSVSA